MHGTSHIQLPFILFTVLILFHLYHFDFISIKFARLFFVFTAQPIPLFHILVIRNSLPQDF